MEELKERYKMLPLWARLLLAAVLGLAPAAYIYFDEGDTLDTQMNEAKSQQDQAREKFEAARKKKANLPKLEEQKDFTEQQLIKAKKSLPDSFRIEDVLQKTATIGKQSNVKLSLFEPGKEVQHRETFQYVELPIATEIEGRFGQIAAFFDKVVHLEGSIFLRRLALTRVEASDKDDEAPANGGGNAPEKSAFQKAKDARAKLRVRARFDLVVFRGMTDKELAEVPVEPADGKGPGKGGKGKNPGAPGAPAANGAPGAPPPADAPAKGAAPAKDGPVSQSERRPAAGGGERRL